MITIIIKANACTNFDNRNIEPNDGIKTFKKKKRKK